MKSKMQIDLYTKFILTIIALCIILICLKGVKENSLLPVDVKNVDVKSVLVPIEVKKEK